MPTKDLFEDESTLRKYLASQLSRGRLALVFGAGVSLAFGLPSWGDFITRLYSTKGESAPPGIGPELLASHFRRTFFPDDPCGLVKAIYAALYSTTTDASFAALHTNDTLAAIASLVMASQRGSVAQVVTFNFDNLLEIYLRYHGFVVQSASEPVHWASRADVLVYHPHGMIPYELSPGYDKVPLLDQESYSKIVGDPAHPWRQLMLTILRRHTCLFIGLSGSDQNLLSLLAAVRGGHASELTKTCFWGVTFSDSPKPVLAGSWNEARVYYKVMGSWDRLPPFLFGICQDAAKMKP